MLNIDLSDRNAYDLPNWADKLDEEQLTKLGQHVCESTEADAASREPWLADTQRWLDMAQQVIETKTTPWPNASAVKFPLLTTAALQFHARAHQELLKGERIVKGKVLGKDEDGMKAKRAKRVEAAMTNQLLYKMEDWSDDTDRLLFVLPLVGTVFRKTYWSGLLRRPASELVLASELVVNYYATDWERARKTHIFLKDKNEVVEQQRMGNYLEADIPEDPAEPADGSTDPDGELPEDMEPTALQEDTPYTIYEQHGWYDLDEDGYQEPYIVTVESESQLVLRVTPRFLPANVEVADDDTILRITPIEYVVVYKFLPDVDSSIYGVGIGKLLGPTGAAIDTIINQLVDSGTLNTMPSGFIGRGVRLSRGGRIRLNPGEWKVVNSTGEDLQKNFFAMPTKEPSGTLFQLLGMLISAGEKMGSTTEALSGENPGQNQPFSTTSAVMEQGMQVFLGIYKRVYRSLTKEFRMLYQLNQMHLATDAYNELLDEGGSHDPAKDFNTEGLDIIPEADPSLANSMRKQRRVAALIEGQRSGMKLNQDYVTKIFLEAIDEPEVEQAMKQMPRPPSAEEMEAERHKKDLELEYMKLQVNIKLRENQPQLELAKAMEHMAKAKALGDDAGIRQMEMAITEITEQHKRDSADLDRIAKLIELKMKGDQERAKAQNPNSGRTA